LLGLLPFTLLSCGRNTSAEISSSKNSEAESSTSSSSSAAISSSSSESVISSSSAAEDSNFAKLRKALKYVALQEKIELDTTNGSTEFDADGSVTTTTDDDTETTTDSDSSTEANDTTITSFTVDAKLSNITSKVAVKGLKALNVNQIGMSTSITNDLNLKYTVNTDPIKNQDITKQNVGLDFFYYGQYVYADFDNTELRSIFSTILSDFSGSDQNIMAMVPQYFKIEAKNDATIDELPISNFEDETIDSFVDQLESMYNSITSAADGIITMREENDYTYIDFSLNSLMVKLLPELYKSYAESQLDQTSDDYQTKLDQIAQYYSILKDVTDHMTVNSFKITLGYTEYGIQSLDTDIDVKITDIASGSDDTTIGGMTVGNVTAVNFTSVSLKLKKSSTVKYGTAVTVNVPGNNTYTDLSSFIKTN
jgi:hypothetical protein